ncbi:hypothetical protein Hypma_004994 [Hypsizygus marmoreus]|uniref:Uncharacterized protein n=1 Tax=Hypsizygus marmoreus TaxID=39966 RepID=A0A369K2V8_HYPMA|nr:hypothetical protein Hypma_004994 [Hypsizygus marmoreus]
MQLPEATTSSATKMRDALARVPDWMQLVLVIIVSSIIGILLGSYGISLQRFWSHTSNEYPPRHRKGPSSLCPIPEAVAQGAQLQESWTAEVESGFQEDTLAWWMRV